MAAAPSGLFSRGSLQAKFFAVVLPVVLLSTIAVFGIFELLSRRASERQLEVKLDRMVDIQSAVLAESLWNVADHQIQLILAALLTDTDVIGAVVYDERDTPVAAAGDTTELASRHYFAEAPITYDYDGSERQIGKLALALTNSKLEAMARQRIALAGGLAAILVASVVVSTLVANRRTIGRPLGLLLDSIKRESGPRARVDWHSRDEIGAVVAAFNGMQQRQDEYEAELRASRDELERRVAERTDELALAMAEAQRVKGQLTDAIESITEGFALFGPEEGLVVANTRFRDIMLGDPAAAVADGVGFRAIVEQAAASGRFPNARPDTTAWVERQLERLRGAGEPAIQELAGDRWQRVSNRRTEEGGTVAVYSDITALKRVSDELRRAKDAAEAANEAKTAFLATMSHEIRTPLNGIIGMSRLLGETRLDSEQSDYAATIIQASDTLLSIINDILDFSKVEAGALELEQMPVDLPATLEEALELVAARAAEKRLELVCQVEPDVPRGIVGDPIRLKQVLLNILSNAVKFTETGEIVLRLALVAPPPSAGSPVQLAFSVRDTGVGIPTDRMDRLFKSFSQVDASTTRRYGGTGLGLAISKRLVELMGGTITVESQIGVGTTFGFTIAASLAALPEDPNAAAWQAVLRGRRALVVDDNATNRQILEHKLAGWGLEVTALGLPIPALDRLTVGEAFDICIFDYSMPEMDGLELTRRVREALGERAPPIILFSATTPAGAEFRDRLRELNFSAVLTKPAKSRHILKSLVDALEVAEGRTAANDGHAAPEACPAATRRDESQPLSVLLVDDNRINQKVASRILQTNGYAPDVVGSGEEAVRACLARRYDVVLMDIEMPEMDGIAATALIRSRISASEQPYVVALTANAMAAERQRYLASGMDAYLSKPIDVDALTATLRASARFLDSRGRSRDALDAENRGV